LKTCLKPGGIIVILDQKKDSEYTAKPPAGFQGPPESMRVTPQQVEDELKAAGYKLHSAPDVGMPFHFLRIFDSA